MLNYYSRFLSNCGILIITGMITGTRRNLDVVENHSRSCDTYNSLKFKLNLLLIVKDKLNRLRNFAERT